MKKTFDSLKKIFLASLMCGSITYDFAPPTLYIYRDNLDASIKQAADEYLSSQGLCIYHIPDRLRVDLEQKLYDARRTLLNKLSHRYNKYLDYYDIKDVVIPILRSFTDNLKTVIYDNQLTSELDAAVQSFMLARNINPYTLTGSNAVEYNNRCQAIINDLNTIMYRDNRNYVRTYEIQKAIKDNLDVFASRMRNVAINTFYNWWDSFFANPVVTTQINYEYTHPIATQIPVATAIPIATPIIPVATDPNQIMGHDLEPVILTTAQQVLYSHNIDANNIPARAVAEYSDKIQRSIHRLHDKMTAAGRNYVWKDEIETTLLEELQSVVDKVTFKNETCSICLDNYTHNQRVGILSCGHAFHNTCINQWLGYQNTCPLCRANNVIVAQQENMP